MTDKFFDTPLRMALSALAMLALAACTQPADDMAGGDDMASGLPAPLADTTWRLVEFQSMSDAIGTRAPMMPSDYTMTLNGDGTVAMQLNCNSATGTWTAEASASPDNGSFMFGPLAMTRAFCPPPSMDEQIARDAEYVRGYIVRDGRLALSLMADGGIYLWEPAP